MQSAKRAENESPCIIGMSGAVLNGRPANAALLSDDCAGNNVTDCAAPTFTPSGSTQAPADPLWQTERASSQVSQNAGTWAWPSGTLGMPVGGRVTMGTMGDGGGKSRLTRSAARGPALLLSLAAVVAYLRLVAALLRMWGDLFDGGSVGAHRLLVGMVALPIVLALVGLGLARWRRWSWVGATVTAAVLVILGSTAAILIAAGANLTST